MAHKRYSMRGLNSPKEDVRKLQPNKDGYQRLKIEMDDRRLGYMLVEDWAGRNHRFELRKSEDYLTIPVPKVENAKT